MPAINPCINTTLGYHEVKEENEGPYFDFINEFLNMLEPRLTDLEKLGITNGAISIWILYEYYQQCNMEFDPDRMKKLGDAGITLASVAGKNKLW